jgi:TRAP-type C4-dicarboxylate transport system permease small subunit
MSERMLIGLIGFGIIFLMLLLPLVQGARAAARERRMREAAQKASAAQSGPA